MCIRDRSSAGLWELSEDSLTSLEFAHFREFSVDFGSCFFDLAFWDILLRIGEDVLSFAVDLWLFDFGLAPEGQVFAVKELDSMEENESALFVGADSDKDGPLDESLELVSPGFDQLERSVGWISFSEEFDDC